MAKKKEQEKEQVYTFVVTVVLANNPIQVRVRACGFSLMGWQDEEPAVKFYGPGDDNDEATVACFNNWSHIVREGI